MAKSISLDNVKRGSDIGYYSPVKTSPKEMGLGVALVGLFGAWRPHISCSDYTDHCVYDGKIDIISTGRIATAKFNKVVFEHNHPDRFFIEVNENHYRYLSRLHAAFDGISNEAFAVSDQTRIGAKQFIFRFDGDRVENLLAILDNFRKLI